ncbi:MAG: tRNA (adenosine(37)-N6)-dimethylallyltransferase MiaA [Clostridia bacterium]|nr:tRNA (adenosine(37)-N6)-dimethylallyltransferase MiaA [Clostridia bacterium]
MEKTILPVVAGPTASGKTACAVALCKLIGGEVISADSMQIYSGMSILSAMPGPEETKGVPHHLMGCVDPGTKFSADAYREAAKACIEEVRGRGCVPVLCGGTGLYIDAVTRPMSFSQQSDEALHRELIDLAAEPDGRTRLHAMLSEVDPESARRLHENDVRRVARAIEIYRLTGITQTEHTRLDRAREGDYREVLFALDWPRDALYSRIDARVEEMLRAGLVDEVKALMADEASHPTACQAIGYKEIAEALNGETSMERAVWRTKQATRNLAKRQLTWFRRDPRVIWLDAVGKTAEELAEQMRDLLVERFGSQYFGNRDNEDI